MTKRLRICSELPPDVVRLSLIKPRWRLRILLIPFPLISPVMLLVIFCIVISRVIAKFTVDLQLQTHTPITVALPSAAPPWILSSNIPISLSLSPCPLSSFPTSLVTQPTTFSILLDKEQVDKVTGKGNCGNSTQTNLFATVTADEEVTGALFMEAVAGPEQHSSPIEVDGSTYFSITKSQYVSFFFQLHSIEQGLNLEIGLAHGSAEVFVSFCVDIEGSRLGRAVFPAGFKRYIDPVELVQLIETYSCDGGALYHDLETAPPAIIVRIRSASTTGALVVTAEEHHAHGSRLHRAAVAGDRITLGLNDTITLDFPVEANVSFAVLSGEVSVSGILCAEEEPVHLGTFSNGNHTILSTSLAVECNVTMSRVALTWFAEDDSILSIETDEQEQKSKKMPWYVLAGILLVSAAAVSLVVGGIFYAFSKAQMNGSQRKEDTGNNIPMTTLHSIPLDGDRWQ